MVGIVPVLKPGRHAFRMSQISCGETPRSSWRSLRSAA